MSSIYRKGRDGYFYYQTYVFNKKSGKKDKKIFHALKTKSRNKAEKKKIELDLIYTKIKKNKYFISDLKKSHKFSLFFIFLLLIAYFNAWVIDYNESSEKSKNLNQSFKIETPKKDTVRTVFNENKENIKKEDIIEVPKNDMVEIKSTNDIDTHNSVSKNKMDFEIIRTEKHSGTFKQIKIFALVESTIDSLNKNNICKKIKSDFSDYSNIIICLFSNNDIGKRLAMNENGNISSTQRVKNWLALFTYNSVEGEYFDSNPGGYLDVY